MSPSTALFVDHDIESESTLVNRRLFRRGWRTAQSITSLAVRRRNEGIGSSGAWSPRAHGPASPWSLKLLTDTINIAGDGGSRRHCRRAYRRGSWLCGRLLQREMES